MLQVLLGQFAVFNFYHVSKNRTLQYSTTTLPTQLDPLSMVFGTGCLGFNGISAKIGYIVP